ncbi:TonB-dependent receptor [Pseudomonas synxantha]|uniref:TonB-dependent receptor plug domain-containing protein n=1 Tax=Pseudomonas synxantha TaxID=47883 RepID=A0A5D3GJG8_9PSED|nr:TonB-dependent receptor [Pseudomonas synxantha]TYK60380.1 TonB-dependent receptor plug domain-containing protein [Pseudomonas synxantha]
MTSPLHVLRSRTLGLLFLGLQPLYGAAVLAADERQHFHIDAGTLDQVLSRFGVQAGISMAGRATLTAGKSSQGLTGDFTTEAALTRLLEGTRLSYQRLADGSYELYPGGTALALPTQKVTGEDPQKQQVYSAPRSSVYISGEDMQRFGVISAGDLLKGQPGVQVGDSRNGGGLDVNIRGIQGQSRVAVTVDGAQQALDVYRGYAGTQQRSYIDPDLISDVTIDKGPSVDSSAIGGTVKMRTLGVEDILRDGQNIGLRLKGEAWNNGVAPAYRDGHSSEGSLYAEPHRNRGGLFGSQAESGSAAFAYTHDLFDVVAAYAHRNQGNYFAGKKGQDRYRTYDRYGDEESTVASTYNAGEEVLNSSAETESWLLKTTIRPTDEHTFDLGYQRYNGHIGEIMPSDIFRFGTGGIYQYPLGHTRIDTYTARYHYLPTNNPLVDLTTSLWMTDAQTSQLTSVLAPASQAYRSDRNWSRQANRRIGGDLANTSRFTSDYGDLKLDLGGGFQVEELRPQKGVVTTQHDINANRSLRDGSRQEFNLNGKLEYQPVDRLTLWGGGRYTYYRTQDHVPLSTARREERPLRYVSATNAGAYGNMLWFPDMNGDYTDATDPRLNNGIVFSNTNYPFEGPRYNDFGATDTTAYEPQVGEVVSGYDYSGKNRNSGGAFAPAFGINLEVAPDTFVYASYTQGLRMPSLFETSQGVLQTLPGKGLKPERSSNWEIGASTLQKGLFVADDEAAIKLAYFNNTIKNYITRYYDPSPGLMGQMQFSNTDSFKTSGLELQSHYDAGRVFADLSSTYYLKTQTCDSAFAARLRASSNRYRDTSQTPNCTPGSFMGSYTNTQNPPRFAANLTTGVRFFDQSLTVGTRITYTSGPTVTADKPWQTGATTPQLVYREVTLVDLFLNYKLQDHTQLNVSLQNLTDRYYLDPLAQSFMPAPGRTLRVGLQTTF